MTFYTVKYSVWGADKAKTAYFDSKESAQEFYNNRDHVDPPQAINVTTPESIDKYSRLCQEFAWSQDDQI